MPVNGRKTFLETVALWFRSHRWSELRKEETSFAGRHQLFCCFLISRSFAGRHQKEWVGCISCFSHFSLHRCFLTSIHLFCHFPFFFPGGVEPGEDDVSETRRGVVPFPRRGLRLRHAQVLLIKILLFSELKPYKLPNYVGSSTPASTSSSCPRLS